MAGLFFESPTGIDEVRADDNLRGPCKIFMTDTKDERYNTVSKRVIG